MGYQAYGDEPGPRGPWATFDGRNMPTWPQLESDTGKLTRERWEVAAKAVVAEHEQHQRSERAAHLLRRIGCYARFSAEYLPEDDSFLLTARDGSGEQEHVDADLLAALERVEPRETTEGGAARHCLSLFGVDAAEEHVDPFLLGISEIARAYRDLAHVKKSLSKLDPHKAGALNDGLDEVTAQLRARVRLLAQQVTAPSFES